MGDTQTNNDLTICIVSSTMFILTLPLYIFGGYKFWHFREHLLIQKRFPVISATIVIMLFIIGVSNIIINWTNYFLFQTTQKIGDSIALFVYGLINLRLCLIYLRWKQNTSITHSQLNYSIELSSNSNNSTVSSNINNKTYKKTNIYYHWSSILILTFTVCSFCFMTISAGVSYTDDDITVYAVCWTGQLMTSIIVVSIIVFKKVNEGIGCLRETVILLLMAICILFVVPFHPALIAVILLNLNSFFEGLIPLYVALYYVQTVEGTVNVENVHRRQSRAIDYQDTLFIFIDKYENYKLLKEYLSHCWALENILFYQRASIIYQIILKYKNMYSNGDRKTDVVECRNKFEFLSSIYAQYELRINVNGDEIKFEDIQIRLYNIQQDIYKEFIATGSVNQVNLPCKIRDTLSVVMVNDENVKKFNSYDDFLHLYDDAIINIYQLIQSMYQYKFKEYVTNKQNEK
eukprot:273688_1